VLKEEKEIDKSETQERESFDGENPSDGEKKGETPLEKVQSIISKLKTKKGGEDKGEG